MAQTTVDFESYQAGRLPDVCVFTGVQTSERMIIRTPIDSVTEGSRAPGRLIGSLDRLVATLDPRRPHELLLGRLPVDPRALHRRRFELRAWLTVAVIAGLGLVLAAWSGAGWSPIAAVLSVAALAVALLRRAELRRQAPRPTLIGAGTRVHLDNVHEEFVAAVESRRP